MAAGMAARPLILRMELLTSPLLTTPISPSLARSTSNALPRINHDGVTARSRGVSGERPGIRTLNLVIKSHLLCR